MKKYAFVLWIIAFSVSSFGYTRITTSTGEMPKWPTIPVPYWINEKGLSSISNGSEFAAVHASFHTWESVSSANIQFLYKGTTSAPGVGRDGLNVISFADNTTPLGTSTIAATFSFFRRDAGVLVIDEADVIFNTALQFSTSAEDGKFDIQSVLTHELGHFVGLDHSALVSSVMVPFGVIAQLDQRTLSYDDIAAVTEVYPNAAAIAGLGRIQGSVRSGTSPLLGAHIVAVNSEGTSLVSAVSRPDGTYTLPFLPPGLYRVFAEPLDLPVTKDNIGGTFYAATRTDFGTTYFGNVSNLSDATPITVVPGGAVTANIETLPRSATGLNLTRPAFGVRLARGVNGILTLGGEDITPGIIVSPSNPGIGIGTLTFGGRISASASTSVRVPLAISPSIQLGPKNMAVNRGTDASIAAGALVITDTVPSGINVAPGNGPVAGGTSVTITGINFRPGAQVYFGGLAATDIDVVNTGIIVANAPPSAPGTINIVVVNSDGTWGVAPRAFMYDAQPPVITRVSPLSGPPGTLVVIEGANFGTQLQNVAVFFGGVAGRVLSTTATAITTIVPFAAVTGPVDVSSFGQFTTGPVFTVTTPAPSRNVAKPISNFIDATAASGGTNLAFSSDDDAIDTTALPFNFSLFRDIYLAGSRISIATNGFLSLEHLSTAEFQNRPLPGQDFVGSTGTAGSVPPALIAPFWDDLFLESGSSVSTRTVGTAPNRQFIVEWSNMSILDEDGTDLGASLTFEVVLFEGSNDIQYQYRNMSGPRSDGSSATIGAQDLKRITAIQTGFNQALVSSGSFVTYHFDNGSYLDVTPDATPPTKPVVTDEGTLTANRFQLAASWTADDEESGISGFQYAVGTTPGGSEVKPFTSVNQNSVVITGLNLQAGVAYYFAVKAVNGAGLMSDVGLSDGIRYEATYQPQTRIIPSAPASNNEFSGIALFAPTAMTVVLRAYDSAGAWILGPGIRNPATISLAAGQQSARVLSELFGIQVFDGWIEAEASVPGVGIFTATGAVNLSTLDGTVARDPSTDFILFHAGASAIFVNPSTRIANVTLTPLSAGGGQSFSIPARGRLVTTLTGPVRVRSSEALAALERVDAAGKLGINSAVDVSEGQANLTFAHGVVGGTYSSTLTLVNLTASPQLAVVTFANGTGPSVTVPANGSTRVTIGSSSAAMTVGAVKMSTQPSTPASIVGVLDIDNGNSLVSITARPASTEFTFPHVANGVGLFTGLALATGNSGATVTIDVYGPDGGIPNSGTVTLAANQQLARLVSELVSGVDGQVGGYIRVRSDQPIWTLEIYGSGEAMAAGPPL